VRRCAGDRGVTHPQLTAGKAVIGSAGRHRLPEQCPLHTVSRALGILQVRREVPPLDPIVGMRAVIRRKGDRPAGNDARETTHVLAEAGKPLRI
jgi:hypothetical protein